MEFLPIPESPEADCVRELTREEIQSYVKPHYDATGNPLPDARYSTFIGLVRDGRIVGAIGLQLKLHAQPLMLDDKYSAGLSSLIDGVEKHILSKCGPQWVYLFSPAGRLTQLAQLMGMVLEPWCVLSKLVTPPVPPKDTFQIAPLGEMKSATEVEQ